MGPVKIVHLIAKLVRPTPHVLPAIKGISWSLHKMDPQPVWSAFMVAMIVHPWILAGIVILEIIKLLKINVHNVDQTVNCVFQTKIVLYAILGTIHSMEIVLNRLKIVFLWIQTVNAYHAEIFSRWPPMVHVMVIKLNFFYLHFI